MLVLTRKVEEEIFIGDDIVIKVAGVTQDGRVRLGVTAPREIPVDRGEVRKIIERDGLRMRR